MQSTRSLILSYLADHPFSSAAEIGRYLDMTAANIRYHLGLLEKEGRVQVSAKRSPGGAGRPISLFNLSSQTLGNSLSSLIHTVLDWIGETENPREGLGQIAALYAGDFPRIFLNRVQRYNKAIAFLNKRRYHASWEARPGGPLVTLRHCPYLDLAQSQPLICQMDEELLSRLFGLELTLSTRRSFGPDPFSPCRFQISPKQEEKG